MIRVFIRHKVSDYAKWRKVYDDFEETRAEMGEIGDEVFQAFDDPNDITVTHDFETIEKAKALFESAALREAMQKAGVASAPDIWFTNAS